MNAHSMHAVALRFANTDPRTKAGANIAASLSDNVHEILWGNDPGGDLYLAGLSLVAAIGHLRNAKTYDDLLKLFPEWWKLDGSAAKAIAHKLDQTTEPGERSQLEHEIAEIATWFEEDECPFDREVIPTTWEALRKEAQQWHEQDSAWLSCNRATWSSELAPSTYSYYSIEPAVCTQALLDIGNRVSKDLCSKSLQDAARAGQARIFAVAEVLKVLAGPVAAVVIELTKDGWKVGKVHVKGKGGIPQGLLRVAHLLATEYEARSLLNCNSRKIREAISAINMGNLPESVLEEALATDPGTSHSQATDTRHLTLVDTCSMLETRERLAVVDLVNDSDCTVIIVGAVIDELERKKATCPDLVRDANAALRCIEQWLLDGKAEIEGLDVERQRPYADRDILNSIAKHVKAGATVTLITADTALRVRARASNPKSQLVTIDSRILVNDNQPMARPIEVTGDFRRDRPVQIGQAAVHSHAGRLT